MVEFPVIEKRVKPSDLNTSMVFGERNSGTNLVSELLRQNFTAFAQSPTDRIERFGYPYGWKHAFPQMIAAPATTLAVGVFRHPETWVRSMYARPWHVIPALRDLPFDRFLRAEWQTRIDEQNFGVMRDDPRWGQEMQWDRHPMTGCRFRNICELRVVKNLGFLTLPERFANCCLVRHEDVSADPEGFVAWVSEMFNLTAKAPFQAVPHRRGRKQDGKFEPTKYAPLEATDHGFLWGELDQDQEARLGYTPSAS